MQIRKVNGDKYFQEFTIGTYVVGTCYNHCIKTVLQVQTKYMHVSMENFLQIVPVTPVEETECQLMFSMLKLSAGSVFHLHNHIQFFCIHFIFS